MTALTPMAVLAIFVVKGLITTKEHRMHSTPSRVALAGSVLVLGSVSTVSAVQLQSGPAPLGTTSGTPAALSPAPTGPQVPPAAPSAGLADQTEHSSGASARSAPDSTLNVDELVKMATAPLSSRTVSVAVHDTAEAVSRPVRTVADTTQTSGTVTRRVIIRTRHSGQPEFEREMSERLEWEITKRAAAYLGAWTGASSHRTSRGSDRWDRQSAHHSTSQGRRARDTDSAGSGHPHKHQRTGPVGHAGADHDHSAARGGGAGDYVGRHRAAD